MQELEGSARLVRSHPIFFTHVPRCGGTSLIRHLAARIPPERVYPNNVDDDVLLAKISVPQLLGLPADRLRRIELFCPHVPHAVTHLLDRTFFTVTVVRDPLDRVASVLNMIAPEGSSLERTYEEDEWAHSWFVANQFAVYFGLTAPQVLEFFGSAGASTAGDLVAATDRIRDLTTAETLVRVACETIERIDALGRTDLLGDLYALLDRQLGLGTEPERGPLRFNRGRGRELPAALRRRIAAATEADREVFDYACRVIERRRRNNRT